MTAPLVTEPIRAERMREAEARQLFDKRLWRRTPLTNTAGLRHLWSVSECLAPAPPMLRNACLGFKGWPNGRGLKQIYRPTMPV